MTASIRQYLFQAFQVVAGNVPPPTWQHPPDNNGGEGSRRPTGIVNLSHGRIGRADARPSRRPTPHCKPSSRATTARTEARPPTTSHPFFPWHDGGEGSRRPTGIVRLAPSRWARKKGLKAKTAA